MSTLTHTSFTGFSLLDTLARAPATLRQRLAHWTTVRREIARIERELATYSDRELRELGLFRGDIPAVARGTYVR